MGRSADPRVLESGGDSLPSSIGRPMELPVREGRSPLVGTGVFLGALTLIGGIVLAVVGVIELLSGTAVAGVAELWGGILLVASHWGWVHLGAWASDRLEARRGHALTVDRHGWLDSIEPYARYEVATRVGDDGSITVETICYLPAPTGADHFTFEANRVTVESHPADAPAAEVAERAELLRRDAAARTARARARYEAALEAHQLTQLKGQDEQQQLAARRATSEALSDQINLNQRDPPLVE